MRKDVGKRIIKTSAVFQIFLMISLTFAIAIVMSEIVNAGDPTVTNPNSKSTTPNAGGLSSMASKLFTGQSLNSFANGMASVPAGTNIPTGVSGIVRATDGKLIYSTHNGALIINGERVEAPEGSTAGSFDTGLAGAGGALLAGASWAVVAYGLSSVLGGIIGLKEGQQKALDAALVSGAFVAGTLRTMYTNNVGAFGQASGSGFLQGVGQYGPAIGLGVAVIVFVLMYKDTKTKTVTFQCLPWEPPTGGSRCEECNKDIFRPCTEYRCKSLGQACELLNPNTALAQCAWVSRNDVDSATITPSDNLLTPSGLEYKEDKESIRPPAIGVKIVQKSGKECLDPFTPLQFGFTTNEPAQCKIDYTHTERFKDMQYYVGDDNYYGYNHTQKLRLPGPTNDTSSPLFINNDGTMGFYVRCQDANGNENVDEYVFTFCVDAGPDTTAPVMEEFSVPSGSYVRYNADNVPIELYVNEPATCKWSRQDKEYDDMENNMKCYNSLNQINPDLQYTCAGNVTGVENVKDNNYYFRCKDAAGNKNIDSKLLVLKGSQPLTILSIMPNETVTGSTEYVSVDIEVETGDGAEKGKAACYFSNTGTAGSYIKMFETDNYVHKQELSLVSGDYITYIRCIDAGGNMAENFTNFDVFVDKQAPSITRIYREDHLKIVTDEDAMCSYSLTTCDFEIKDGQEMIYSNADDLTKLFAEWKPGQKYYIKCQDANGNAPDPNKCSVIVNTVELINNEEE